MRSLLAVTAALMSCLLAVGTTATDIPPTTWVDVTATTGRIARIRTLTAFALTAPIPDIESAIATLALEPMGRANQELQLLGQVHVNRDLQAALAYQLTGPGHDAPYYRKGFFTGLAQHHPDLVRSELRRLPATWVRESSIRDVITVLAKTNPTDALALLRDMETPSLLPFLLRDWIKHDPAGALDAVLAETANSPPEQRLAVLSPVFEQLAAHDLGGILEFATRTTDPTVLNAIMQAVVSELTQESSLVFINRGHLRQHITPVRLETLRRFADRQTSDNRRALFDRLLADFGKSPSLHLDLLWAWHQTAPEESRDWVAGLASTPPETFGLLLEIDPALALSRIESAPAGPARADMLGQLTAKLARDDLPDALGMIAGLAAGPEQQAAIDALAKTSAIHDPATLAVAIASLPPDAFATELAKRFGAHWLTLHDSRSALDWFIGLPPGPARTALGETMRDALIQTAPDKAIAFIQTLEDPQERATFIHELAAKQTAAHPEAVFALIESLPPGTRRNYAFKAAIQSLTKDDPASAAGLVTSGAFGPANPKLIRIVADAWTQISAADSARWLAEKFDDPTMPELLKDQDTLFGTLPGVARHYAIQDPASALEWAASLPSADLQTRATLAAADTMAETYPQRAWDAVITTRPTEDALSEIYAEIEKQNPREARRLLENASLPDELKSRIQTGTTRR